VATVGGWGVSVRGGGGALALVLKGECSPGSSLNDSR
jgi:hypothetical protein